MENEELALGISWFQPEQWDRIERGLELMKSIKCEKSNIVLIGNTDHDLEVVTG